MLANQIVNLMSIFDIKNYLYKQLEKTINIIYEKINQSIF